MEHTKRALVIGKGYLGSEVVRVFREQNWKTVATSLSGCEDCLACDVSDQASVDQLPDAEVIVHCAASGRGGEEAYRKVYLEGCKNLVRRFPEGRVLFTSSSSVYGQIDGELVTETSATDPDRETGRLLVAAENVVIAAGGVVARLAGIYGPNRSVLLKKFLAGEAIIEEDGRRFINQIHRDDAATAIYHLLCMENFPAGECFNVADSVTLSQLEVYQGLARIFGMDLPPSGPRDLDRKRGWTHKQVSNTKLRSTGWEPVYPCFLDSVGGL